MSTEARNRHGYPLLRSGNRSPLTAKITDNSNRPLPWIALTCILSSLSLMGVLMMPMVMDAKVKAGSAKCEAVADLARTDAAVAKDTVDQWAAKQKAGVK